MRIGGEACSSDRVGFKGEAFFPPRDQAAATIAFLPASDQAKDLGGIGETLHR